MQWLSSTATHVHLCTSTSSVLTALPHSSGATNTKRHGGLPLQTPAPLPSRSLNTSAPSLPHGSRLPELGSRGRGPRCTPPAPAPAGRGRPAASGRRAAGAGVPAAAGPPAAGPAAAGRCRGRCRRPAPRSPASTCCSLGWLAAWLCKAAPRSFLFFCFFFPSFFFFFFFSSLFPPPPKPRLRYT